MVGAMTQSVEAPIQARRNAAGHADVIIVGAGVFGLWAARNAIRAGKKVLLLEKRKVGSGASGGFLGALMPHMPDRWNGKKQAQFEALVSLEAAIAELERDTGVSCGYRRCGRLMPVTNEKALAIVHARIEGATANWPGYAMEHWPTLTGTVAQGWLSQQVAAFGVQWDNLSARLDPRALISSLAMFVRANGDLQEGTQVTGLADHAVVLADGSRLEAEQIIVANGWEAYPLLQLWLQTLTGGEQVGRGVKGQAILLSFEHDNTAPIVYHDGAYAVPQSGARVAIGSSTVENWQGDPNWFDPQDTGFAGKAQALVPQLAGAPVLEQWAGVRPRNMLGPNFTQAWIGDMPGLKGVSARIGGFKTGMAMAHVEKPIHMGWIS